MPSWKTASLAFLSLLATSFAQTWTECNPLERTDCPPNTALGVSNYTIDFTKSIMSNKVWNTTAGKINYGNQGADFVINNRGDSPTVQSKFYIFFGQLEVIMKVASGQGIVSSIVLQSEDLDEIDWEWIGGNNSYVQTNIFSKGNQTDYGNSKYYPMDDPQGSYQNYTLNWSPEQLEWIVNGKTIRTLKYEDAKGGHGYPQTPCNVRLGIWAGGDPKNPQGTIDWAGGEVNYKDTPFVMSIKSIRATDAGRGTQYVYGDTSGDWQSIKSLNDTKPLELDGENGTSASQNMRQKWNGLPPTTKYIIIGVVGGVVLICIAIFAFCCIRQRRAGKHEKLVEDAKYDKITAEVMAYRAGMTRMRNEKSYAMVNTSPALASPGVGYQNFGQPSPMAGGMSPNQGYGFPNNNYARSVSNFSNGSRGYQRY